jgi:hypothetical protein
MALQDGELVAQDQDLGDAPRFVAPGQPQPRDWAGIHQLVLARRNAAAGNAQLRLAVPDDGRCAGFWN